MKQLSRISRIPALMAAGLPLLTGATLLPLALARPAQAAQGSAPVEPVSASRLVGVALPDGAFRLTDPGSLGELTTQLRAYPSRPDCL